jgi:hypothetical protein
MVSTNDSSTSDDRFRALLKQAEEYTKQILLRTHHHALKQDMK